MDTIEKSQNNIAYFMLPGFCEHYRLYQNINRFLNKYPEAKRENAEIYCYYVIFLFALGTVAEYFLLINL